MSDTAQLWQQASASYQAGDLASAELHCRQIFKVDSTHAHALHLFGVMAVQLGKAEIGIEYLQLAIAQAPDNASFHNDLALAFHSRQAFSDAAEHYRESLRLQPDQAEIHNNLACALADLEQVDEAIEHFRQALQMQLSHPAVHYNLGNALVKKGKSDEAAAQFQQAIALKPDYFEAHDNLGNLLLAQGKPQEAFKHYQQALNINPHYQKARNNLGNALHGIGRHDEAAACYRAVLIAQPDSSEVHFNLGRVLLEQGKLKEAIASLRQAATLKPELAAAHAALGGILSDAGRTDDESLAIVREALSEQPNDQLKLALATCLPAICQSVDELTTWRQRLVDELTRLHHEGFTVDLTDQTAPNVFFLAYQGLNDRDIQGDLGRLYRAPNLLERKPSQTGKIRVGFLSAHFKTHTIGHFMRGMIAQLPRHDLEVTVLSIGRHRDPISDAIRQSADHFVELPRQLRAARQMIADQQLDILVYTDIGLEAISHTLAFSRLAPVQCVIWGHPITTGIPALDYFISADDLETEQCARFYTEKLIKLKTPPIYYHRPEVLPGTANRGRFGFASDDHLYLCAHSLFKFHPEFDPLLAGILRGDRRGKLVLTQGPVKRWQEQLQQRFTRSMPDVMDRVVFLPQMAPADFLEVIAAADLQLDTLHFGGGRASYDALAVGTPIVTLPSPFLRGRYTCALYRQMGMMDAVADSPERYVEIALQIGTDAHYRNELRNRIIEASDRIFEQSGGVDELGEFFQRVGRQAKE